MWSSGTDALCERDTLESMRRWRRTTTRRRSRRPGQTASRFAAPWEDQRTEEGDDPAEGTPANPALVLGVGLS